MKGPSKLCCKFGECRVSESPSLSSLSLASSSSSELHRNRGIRKDTPGLSELGAGEGDGDLVRWSFKLYASVHRV